RPDYEKAVLEDLANSAAFVQLLGPLLGRCLGDVPDGFGWLQYELAKSQQHRILQWRSPDLKDLAEIEDERQRRLLETADAMPFEDFKQKIVRTLLAEERKSPTRPSFIFINCDALFSSSRMRRPGWGRDQIQIYRSLRRRRAKEPQVLGVVQDGPEPRELKRFRLAGLKIIGLSDIPNVIRPDAAQ